MAEKPVKKTVAITVRRQRQGIPKVLVTTGFKLRLEKATGLLDIYFEGYGQKGERISVDPNLLQSNLDILKRYSAGLTVEQDDAAQKDEVVVSESTNFANVVHFSHMGKRAETIFGLFAISDWAEVTREPEVGKTAEIKSIDAVVVISTLEVQKKLLLEIVVLMSQQGKE